MSDPQQRPSWIPGLSTQDEDGHPVVQVGQVAPLAASSRLWSASRLRALADTNLAGQPRIKRLDDLCELAAQFLEVPVVHLTIVTGDTQYFLAGYGLPPDLDEMPRPQTDFDISVCKFVVNENAQLAISDAQLDPVMCTAGAVTNFGLRAYLGQPISGPDGEVLGSFCAWDYSARHWTRQDQLIIHRMASLAMAAVLAT